MSSGLVCVGMLLAFGSLTGTVLVITGVVLMDAITLGSSLEPCTFIAMVKSSGPAPRQARSRPCGTLVISTRLSLTDRGGGSGRRSCPTHLGARGHARTADQVRVQVAREIAQRILQALV